MFNFQSFWRAFFCQLPSSYTANRVVLFCVLVVCVTYDFTHFRGRSLQNSRASVNEFGLEFRMFRERPEFMLPSYLSLHDAWWYRHTSCWSTVHSALHTIPELITLRLLRNAMWVATGVHTWLASKPLTTILCTRVYRAFERMIPCAHVCVTLGVIHKSCPSDISIFKIFTPQRKYPQKNVNSAINVRTFWKPSYESQCSSSIWTECSKCCVVMLRFPCL